MSLMMTVIVAAAILLHELIMWYSIDKCEQKCEALRYSTEYLERAVSELRNNSMDDMK